jgi:hypothetical protein
MSNNAWYGVGAGPPFATKDAITISGNKTAVSGGLEGLRVGWLAYDPIECPNIQSGYLEGDTAKLKGRLTFGKRFPRTPKTFLAIRYFDAGVNFNLRLSGGVTNTTPDGFDYDCGSWAANGDHDVRRISYVWVAVV